MKTVLFNGQDFKFLSYLIDYYRNKSGYDVLLDLQPGHELNDTKQSERLLQNADLIFCEWALGNAVWYSRNKKKNQKLVIRLHAQCIRLHYLREICWVNVDQIIFICQEYLDIFLQRFPEMKSRATLIYNLIDCQSFILPKMPDAFFNLGFIGTAPKSKAPHFALEILKRLRDKDERYTLIIKGKHPWEYEWLWKKVDERKYFIKFYQDIEDSEFRNSIVFDPFGYDLPDWFTKIGFILSTSNHEGSHQAVAEGMAAGSIPVIRNWPGAARLYPEQFVVRSVNEAVDFILGYQNSEKYLSHVGYIQEFAMNNFDIPVITSQYDALFEYLFSQEAPLNYGLHENLVSEIIYPIKVMHVCYLRPFSQSGYEVRIVDEVKALVQAGVRVFMTVFVPAEIFQDHEIVKSFTESLEKATHAKIFLLSGNRFFDLEVTEGLTNEIDKPLCSLVKENDIKILHGQALYSSIHSLRVAQKLGIKIVADIHGAQPEESDMGKAHPDRIRKITELEKKVIQEVSLNIFVSSAMHLHYSEKYGLPHIKQLLIPCCVYPGKFSISMDEREKIRQEKGFRDKFIILYLGTLSIWQGTEDMFNLFAFMLQKIPNSFIYLLIPQYDHDKAREFCSKYGISPDNYLLEEVPHNVVGEIIGAADIGVLLRKHHLASKVSSPIKVGEYLAAGLPVILNTGVGDYSDMVDDLGVGVTIQITDNLITEVENEKILKFAADVQKNREQWAVRCRQVAFEKLNWNVFGYNLAEQYRSVLNL